MIYLNQSCLLSVFIKILREHWKLKEKKSSKLKEKKRGRPKTVGFKPIK